VASAVAKFKVLNDINAIDKIKAADIIIILVEDFIFFLIFAF